MRRVPILLSLLLAGGCAGYASDYWKPKERLIANQLVRYGMSGAQGECVERGLTKALSVWQLRQLGDLAARLNTGGSNPSSLGAYEFIYVAGLAEDAEVGAETRRVIESCNVAVASAPRAPAASPPTAAPPAQTGQSRTPAQPVPQAMPGWPTPPGMTPPASQPPGGEPAQAGAQPLWVNLGAARTGQGIAVDAASVTRGPSWRQAWFRLLNTDQAGVGDVGYLLRIDCAARTITAHAGRKYAPGGALTEQRQYEKPEGPMTIEPGTVIEVAYHALCDDPR